MLAGTTFGRRLRRRRPLRTTRRGVSSVAVRSSGGAGRFTGFVILVLVGLWSGAAGAGPETDRLSLDDAIDEALARNPEVAGAAARLAEAEARLLAAGAPGRLSVGVRASYDQWTRDQRLSPPAANGQPSVFGPGIMAAEFLADYPLFTSGRVSAETDAAHWGRQAVSAQMDRVRETLVFRVMAQYYDLLAQDQVLRALDTAVEAMDEQQRTTQALLESGKAARVDLLRANVRRAELDDRRLRELNQRRAHQSAWAVLLGRESAVAPAVQGSLTLSEPLICTDSAACMDVARAQRPDLRAGLAVVAAAEASVRAARARGRLTISAQATYGLRWMADAADVPDAVDVTEDIGRIGLVATFPLLDGDLTAARVAEQRARVRRVGAGQRQLELRVRHEIEVARSETIAARERVRTAEQAIGQAEESFRIMKEKYALGMGTMTDVLSAQTALVDAQTSHARALADLAVADARRKLAVGEIMP